MRNQRKKAVIFDMDGLLIDSEPLWQSSEVQILTELGIDATQVDSETVLGLRIDEIVKLHFQLSPWQGITIEEVADRIINATTKKIVELRPLMPGVSQALELARGLDLKIGLASASPLRVINTVIDLFDLGDYFDCISSAEYLPYSKPHPEVYLLTAQKLGVSPHEAVAFEDSVNGMIAAKAARMRTVVVPSKSMRPDPKWALADIKLNSLLEVRDLDIT